MTKVELKSHIRSAEASGSQQFVVRWYYNANASQHVIDNSVVRDSFRSNSTSDWQALTEVGKTPVGVALVPVKVVSTAAPDAPLCTATVIEGSEGYFRLGVMSTVALPKSWLPYLGDVFNVGLKMAFLLDATWADGTYYAAEDIRVNVYGFGTVYETVLDPFKRIKNQWGGALAVMGIATPDSTYPLPHVTIDFKIEVVGVPRGTGVRQDWDVLMNWSLFGWNSRYAAEPLELASQSPVSGLAPDSLS